MAGLEQRVIGSIAVLFGNLGGKYPDGKALLVRGTARRRCGHGRAPAPVG